MSCGDGGQNSFALLMNIAEVVEHGSLTSPLLSALRRRAVAEHVRGCALPAPHVQLGSGHSRMRSFSKARPYPLAFSQFFADSRVTARWRPDRCGGSQAAPAGPAGGCCKRAGRSAVARPTVESARDAAASRRVLTPTKVRVCPALRSCGGTRWRRLSWWFDPTHPVPKCDVRGWLMCYSEGVATR